MSKKEIKKYNVKDIEVVDVSVIKGTFVTDNGMEINYKTGIIEFKSKNYPLVFKAKIEKTFMEYFDDMELAPLADSENGSEFWSDK